MPYLSPYKYHICLICLICHQFCLEIKVLRCFLSPHRPTDNFLSWSSQQLRIYRWLSRPPHLFFLFCFCFLQQKLSQTGHRISLLFVLKKKIISADSFKSLILRIQEFSADSAGRRIFLFLIFLSVSFKKLLQAAPPKTNFLSSISGILIWTIVYSTRKGKIVWPIFQE